MLASYKYLCFCLSSGNKMCHALILALFCLFMARVHANSLPEQEFGWVQEHFNNIQKNSPINENLYSLDFLRNSLLQKGYDVPSLSNLALQAKDFLLGLETDIDEESFDRLFSQILLREYSPIFLQKSQSSINTMLIKRKSHIDDSNLTDGFAVGFCKFLAGALCMIVPNVYVRTVGAALISDGIKDMIKNEENPKFPRNIQRTSSA